MRRTLAILKYVPALLCGLLVVAWAVSMKVSPFFELSGASRLNIGGSEIRVYRLRPATEIFVARRMLGQDYRLSSSEVLVREFPITWLVIASLPLAAGPLVGFRFPLWSYFAWTALIAAELAYYLRA